MQQLQGARRHEKRAAIRWPFLLFADAAGYIFQSYAMLIEILGIAGVV